MSPENRAAYLTKVGTDLEVSDALLLTAGPGEIVVKNAAVAINPLDLHQQAAGVFVREFPAILGVDVAGIVYEVGAGVTRFKKGDRVIGRTSGLVTGRPDDGAYALYTYLKEDKAAILPDHIAFTDGVVVPMVFETAVTGLSLKVPGVALPGVSTPALGLPYPSLDENVTPLGKTLVIYGGSSSAGSMATQVATATGIYVIAIAGAHNVEFSKRAGAKEVFDYKDPAVVEKVVEAVERLGNKFIGIFDAIADPNTYPNDLTILAKLGGGHLAATHPPPADVPPNVTAGMIFGINVIATPVWRDFVTPALASGKLQCLPPPTIVGKGLEYIQEALNKLKAGVSATKVVVEL